MKWKKWLWTLIFGKKHKLPVLRRYPNPVSADEIPALRQSFADRLSYEANLSQDKKYINNGK